MVKMATLPPRRNLTPTKISKQHLSPLQILIQMGFSKLRAEKALAATGNKDVQLASDWLLTHVNDPVLDDNSPREYILYACPTGAFLEELHGFWEKSRTQCAWNGAHNFTPHITLVSFFKTPDSDAPHLVQSLKAVMERTGAMLNEPLKLETYTSPNFMGFFVAEEHADHLKRIAMQFVKEVSNATIGLEPHVKSLHLTLAYQFPSNHYNHLKALVDELDPNNSNGWELRLYSRDPRVSGKQVHKVIHPYIPMENDELELRAGDYVYISSEALSSSPDGWVEGTSWLTGTTGYLPESYTERTAESDAWTLHKKLVLNMSANDNNLDTTDTSLLSKFPTIYENVWKEEKTDLDHSDCKQTRRLFLMRHGERVDLTFGTWVPYCFDTNGKYLRKDLNMPEMLPQRQSGPIGFITDTPLTNIGVFQATLVGQAFKEHNITVNYAICSPALRCLQTCDAFLKGYGKRDEIQIKVEPGLFEWLIWYGDNFPDWLSNEEMVKAGYNIDLKYEQFVKEANLRETKENCEQFYRRNAFVTKEILKLYPTGNVLLVGHATSLETCSRELLGRQPRLANEMTTVLQKVPFCSVVQLIESEEDKWEFKETPFPPITHSTNQRFDYKVLN